MVYVGYKPLNHALHLWCQTIWDVMHQVSRFVGANATHSVVYQNEDGKWVTDLAYYSSFEKETNVPDDIANQLQSEEFVGGGKYRWMIA